MNGAENERPGGAGRAGWRPLVDGVDFVPERVARTDVAAARELVRRDGAVILTEWPVEQDSVVNAAAAILGTRLREVERVRVRTTESAGMVTLHRDWAQSLVELHERPVRLRLADPDYVAVLGVAPAATGGASVVVDGYRLVERIEREAPELYEFLTTVDVDITTAIMRRSDATHFMPRICRGVEWTRGGRMVMRVSDSAQPLPNEPQWDEHQGKIDDCRGVLAAAAEQARGDTVLAAGEILFLGNYRCLHGVRAHEGARTTYVLRCRSDAAA